ncbi:MAG: TIGR03936 family radical SAM-associated protein [Microthrixaceae bacterium]
MRIRVRYTKLGKIRFLGHRDLARCWERAIRRVGLPIAYSEGFSPRPKVHYGLALPVGAESVAELIDIDLREPVEVTTLAEDLTDALPRGVSARAVAVLPERSEALQAAVTRVRWRFDLAPAARDSVDVRDRVERLLAAAELPLTIERKAKVLTEDVRSAFVLLDVVSDASVAPLDPAEAAPSPESAAASIVALVATRPRSLRPSEILACLGLGTTGVGVLREEQFTTIEGSVVALLADEDSGAGAVCAGALPAHDASTH